MAANNKAKFDVIVDVDVTTGKVDVTSLLKRLSDDISKNLKKIEAKEVSLPVDFNLDKSKAEIRKAFQAVEVTLDKERVSLKKRAARNAKASGLLKGMLGDLTTDGKIVKEKLRKALGEIASQLKLSPNITKKSPLAPFLQLIGKDVTAANADIKRFQKGFETALNNVSSKAKEAATQQKTAFAELSKALDTNIENKAVKTSEAIKKITKAVGSLKKAKADLDVGGIGGANDTERLRTLKKFQNQVKATVSSLTVFRDELKAAGGTDKDLAKVNKAIEASETLLRGAIARTNELTAAIDKKNAAQRGSKGGSSKELSDLDKAISRTTASQERLNDARSKTTTSKDSGNAAEIISSLKSERAAVLDMITSLQRQIGVQKKAGKSTAALTLELRRLNKAARGLERDLRGPTKTMLEFANSLKTFVRFAVAFKVLGGISQGVRALVGNVIELDDALVSVKTIASATADEMVAVENAVKNVATTTQFTTTEIAQAAQVLAQAGVGPESIASTLSAVANFAAATNASLQVASDLISTIQNVYKQLAPEEIADKLTNAVNISKLTATGLQTIFSRLAQTAKSFNLDFDQVLGAAAVLKNVGIKDSTISTGFRQGLLELLSPDDKTLKVLEKRYKAVGETMSQSAISTLFSSFKSDANPLLRVLDELEKLGIQGSGAEDFERLFDVRASNVINALIDNKEQFVKNTEAIGRTGAAAKGAKTQLESLAKGTDNLIAVVSTLAADLSGPLVDGLKGVVSEATEAANALRDMFNVQKELTGSSGLGASVELGVAAGGAAAAKGLGAGKAVIAGLLTAGISTAVNANAGKGQGVTEGVTKALSTVLEVVATLSILKAFFPDKDIEGLKELGGKAKKALKDPKKALGGALTFLKKSLTRMPILIGIVVAGVAGVATLLSEFFDSSLDKTLSRISAQSDALGKRIEDDKAAVAEAEKNLAAIQKAENADASAGRKLGIIDDAIRDIVNTAEESVVENLANINAQIETGLVSEFGLEKALKQVAVDPDVRRAELKPQVSEIFSKRAGTTKDIGSDAFDKENKEINKELAALGLKPVTKQETVKILTQQDNLIAEAEGRRLLFTDNLTAALENSVDPDNRKFLDAWGQLTQAEKDRYSTSIDSVDDAAAFMNQIAGRNADGQSAALIAATQKLLEAQDRLSQDQLKKLQLQIDAIEAAQKSSDRSLIGATFDEMLQSFAGDNGAVEFFLAIFRDDVFVRGAKKSIKDAEKIAQQEINKGQASLTKAVQAGVVGTAKQIAEALLKVNAITMEEAKAAIDNAGANAEAAARKEIKNKIKAIAEGRRVVAKPTTPFDKKEETSDLADVTSRDKASRKGAVEIENDLKDALVRIKEAQLEALDDEEKLTALKKQEVQIEGLILDQASRIQNLGSSREKDAQKVKQIKQGFLFEELRVKELTKQIGEAKALELRDQEKFTSLLSERLALEEKALAAEKVALTQSIKNELERQGKGGFEEQSLEEILAGIQNSQLLATEGYGDLAGLVKEAVQVQDKLNQATERYTNDLDNYLRKELNSQLSKAQTKLSTQQSKTQSIEGKLSTATNDLAKSREDLAKIYDDQAEDERFFEELGRGIRGEAANQKGDAKALNKRAQAAGTPEESINLAKEAASLAKTLLDQGDLTTSQAERISGKSEGIVGSARNQLAAEKSAEIARNRQKVIELNAQHVASLNSEKLLQGSVDNLKTSIENLPDKIKKALQGLAGGATGQRGGGEDETTKIAKKSAKVTDKSNKALEVSADSHKEAAKALTSAAAALSKPKNPLGTSGDTGSFSGKSVDGKSTDGTLNFVKDIGKNTAQVTEDNTTRLENLQRANIDPDSFLAKSILQSVSPSVIQQGYSVGGLITGPGNGRDDKAGNFALSDNEFVQPAAATEKYGKDFMEQIRSLKLPVDAVRGTPSTTTSSVRSNQSGAEALAKASGVNNKLRPVTLNVGGAKFSSNASDESISSFRKSLAMQALKAGTK